MTEKALFHRPGNLVIKDETYWRISIHRNTVNRYWTKRFGRKRENAYHRTADDQVKSKKYKTQFKF